jgi:glycogen synthase
MTTPAHPKHPQGTLDQKASAKAALQQHLGWPKEPKRPMLCLPCGMTEALGGTLFEEVLPGILALPIELLVLGRGSSTYGSLFTKLSKDHKHRVHIVADAQDAQNAMLAAADMALFLSTSTPSADLIECLRSGVVPVCPPTSLTEDYNPVQESGNAFHIETPTKWHAFSSLVRAVETHKFPFDWRTIQKHAVESVRGK